MEILILFTMFAWLVLVIALAKDDKLIGFIAAMFLIVIGVWVMSYGIGLDNNDLTRAFAYIHIGIGAFICLIAGIEILQDLDIAPSIVED